MGIKACQLFHTSVPPKRPTHTFISRESIYIILFDIKTITLKVSNIIFSSQKAF